MCRDTVLVPRVVGDFTSAPGNSSDIITIESPILIAAFMIVPPGPGARETSFAPKAFLYQSIAGPAPWIARYGVTVRNPGGIGDAVAVDFRAVTLPRFAFRAMEFSPPRERGRRLKPRYGRWAKEALHRRTRWTQIGFSRCGRWRREWPRR